MTELLVEIADKVAGVGVSTSYGDPIDLDGASIVPVALSYYGFGAGSGKDDSGDEAGGGGGGGLSIPLGAYVGRGGEVRFEPNLIGLLLAATPFVWVVGKSLRWIIRALKR
ncbi:hypothetical protein ACDF64_15900 [Agromyces sp. MMS24-JH15]|uniref:hypothetical protein n=1 Tax=Agromyces sp. MMS24-JH15 TaxID=3243765 RepID=UPI003748433F